MTFPDRSKRAILHGALLLAACSTTALAQSPATPPAAPMADMKPEEAYTQTILPPQPQWAYVRGGFGAGGVRIFDGATGKMRGTIDAARSSDMAIDPANKFYYVSETIWSKGDRGTRQDMISVYDVTQNKLQAEIPMPGRIIIGGQKNNFILSDDGKTAYVYNYDPASSVNMVDLVKRKFVRAIELPGCASLMPNPGVGFSALCSDGSLVTVATGGAKPQITHSASFFQATADPIFDNFAYDKTKKQVTFITYTGLVYQVTLGAQPQIGTPFSIQEAAGVRRGETKPLDVNWLPGGRQLMALHKPSGHLYVLMHKGEYWSQKEEGEEIWDLDLASRKVVKRRPLKQGSTNIEVTQDAAPLILINDKDGTVYVLDAKTMEEKRKIEKAGPGLILTADVGTPATAPPAAAAPTQVN